MLPPLELREPEREVGYLHREPELEAHIRAADRLLSSDPSLGLQAFLNIRVVLDAAEEVSSISTGEFGPTLLRAVSEERVPEIVAAMGGPQYAPIRDDLRRRLVLDCQFKGGVARVVELAEAMDLTSEEQRRSVGEMLSEGMMGPEPEAMLAWMAEVQPEQIPRAFEKWAKLDQTAATDWIVRQEPSSVRDRTIAQFALEASSLDLEAAAEWALEIGDVQLREETLRRVINR